MSERIVVNTGPLVSLARIGCLEMSEQDPRFDPRFREPVASDKIDVQLGTNAVDAWAERPKAASRNCFGGFGRALRRPLLLGLR